MKARTALLTLVMCLLAGTLWAAENPTIGTWKLDEAKSKIAPGVGKNTTVVYAADGDNMKVTLDGMNSSGQATHSEWVGKLDGKPYPVTGDPNVDMRSVKQVNTSHLRRRQHEGWQVSGHREGRHLQRWQDPRTDDPQHGERQEGRKSLLLQQAITGKKYRGLLPLCPRLAPVGR